MTAIQTWFEIISRQRAALVELVGENEARDRLLMVQELMARLPNRYLLAATKAEFRAAGRGMLAEGRSHEAMRGLQETLVGFLDRAHAAGTLPRHPLRDPGMGPDEGLEAPEAALVVGVGSAELGIVAEILRPSEVEVFPVGSPAMALRRVAWFPFTFIITVIPSVAPVTFLATVRDAGSLCRTAGVVLLARGDQLESARSYVGRGANRVIARAELAGLLPDVITELGTVSERTRVRLKAHVDLDDGQTVKWHSENVSSTGMLLRTPDGLAMGTEIDLHFTVPGDDLPIHTRAKVVRLTTFGREDFSGVAVRFLSFVGEGRHRLELFLRRGTR